MFICIQIKQLQSYVFYFILTSTTIKYHERTETRLRLPTSERAAAEQYNLFVILSIKRHIVFARMLAFGSLTQIRHSVADSAGDGIDSYRHIASFEIFEENLAVMQLVVSCFGKNIGQAEIIFFCGLFCIISVAGISPRLTDVGLDQTFFSPWPLMLLGLSAMIKSFL